MGRIDDYRKIVETNQDIIKKLDWCMGNFSETDSKKLDLQKSKLEFTVGLEPDRLEPVIRPYITYGYIDLSTMFSVTEYEAYRSIVNAINMYIPEIIPTAQKLLQAEIDEARSRAADEVKEIMGDLECGENCECNKIPNKEDRQA